MDVKMTFLNADLEEEVYMKQPEGFSFSDGEHLVCKLKKSIYGIEKSLLSVVFKIPWLHLFIQVC